MFKNYLTYNFALNFHRTCMGLKLPSGAQERLMRSSETMIHHFARSIHAKDRKEEARLYVVSLLCLRDCKQIIDEAGAQSEEVTARFPVLEGRLEQLCLKHCEAEQGQLRMLG